MDNSERKLYYLFFTERGGHLAEKLASVSGGEVSSSREAGGVHKWTECFFFQADGLIFVGAAGIAVRAIAPFIKSKVSDPAVIVIDEGGSFVIPVLSGHLGGANDLARELAAVTGGVPVITTATDVSGRFAVDEWAKRQHCHVKDPKKIVRVSSKILSGQEIAVQSDWPVSGATPELVRTAAAGEIPDVTVSIRRQETPSLRLVPRIAVLGIGCRKGTEADFLERCFERFLEDSGIEDAAVCSAASIDLKKDEPGLTEFCRRRGIPFVTYTAEQLRAAEGDFTPSAFVREITGVDNVCERSAVLAADGGGLLVRKTKFDGVTMALALKPCQPDWNWKRS